MGVCLVPSLLRLPQHPTDPRKLNQFHKQRDPFFSKSHLRCSIDIPYCSTRPQIVTCTSTRADAATGLRVFLVSDLHTDHTDNMSWVKSLSSRKIPNNDALIVAGDVSETFENFVSTMSLLKDSFQHVFFVPGNHDLWCRRESQPSLGSLEKLEKLICACQSLGIDTKPKIIDGLGIIPLFSWYHESFDKEDDITGFRIPSLDRACKDLHACRWPSELKNEETSLALHFDAMNDDNQEAIEEIKLRCSHIISFSHFLPRQDLCPEKRMLLYPNLAKIMGSDFLESRIRSIHEDVTEKKATGFHGFGHTHFCWDAMLDGIRYVQTPLAYPRERKRWMNGGEAFLPFCIYSHGSFADQFSPCYWSDYYALIPRNPQNTELAPWVAKRYARSSSS